MSLLMIALQTTETSAGAKPYIVGGAILLLFLFVLFCMLAFGKGRDHS